MWLLQSSYAHDRIRNFLVYKRVRTASVGRVTQNANVTATDRSKYGGSLNSGVTPAGGVPAGPFRMA